MLHFSPQLSWFHLILAISLRRLKVAIDKTGKIKESRHFFAFPLSSLKSETLLCSNVEKALKPLKLVLHYITIDTQSTRCAFNPLFFLRDYIQKPRCTKAETNSSQTSDFLIISAAARCCIISTEATFGAGLPVALPFAGSRAATFFSPPPFPVS